MAYKIYKPALVGKQSSKGVFVKSRIYILNRKTPRLDLIFSNELLKKLNWKLKDKIEFSYNEDNIWDWILEKKSSGRYTLMCPRLAQNCSRISLALNIIRNDNNYEGTKKVKYEILDGKLHIFGNIEDLEGEPHG